MTKITAKQACEAYMESGATVCPFCGGDIIADEMTGEGNCQFQDTHCSTCGAKFQELYRLESAIVENGPTQTGITGIKEYVQ